MKWFFRILNLMVAAIAFFLLYQHLQPPLPLTTQLPAQVELPAGPPAAVPAPVLELFEALDSRARNFDEKRFSQLAGKLDDHNLRELVQSLPWDAPEGQELAGVLKERKLVAPDDLKALEAGNLKDLAGIRKCLTDPNCLPVLEKCLLPLKDCIIKNRCWPLIKNCCRYPCRFPICSNTLQVGLVGGSYKTVKKIRFDGNFTVTLDGTDTAVVTLNIPDNSLNGAKISNGSIPNGKLAENYAIAGHDHGGSYAAAGHDHAGSYAASGHNHGADYAGASHHHDAAYAHANQTTLNALTQAHLDHATATTNPHNVTKAQVGLGNVNDVAQLPLSEKGAPNGVATLDATGKILGSLLAESYSLSGHLHDANYVRKVGTNAVVDGDFYKKSGGNCYNIPAGWQNMGPCP